MSAREDYAKLNAVTSGPRHQGQTSREAQAALNEIDRLRSWKLEAMTSLAAWDDVWVAAGQPGPLGSLKSEGVRRIVEAQLGDPT